MTLYLYDTIRFDSYHTVYGHYYTYTIELFIFINI